MTEVYAAFFSSLKVSFNYVGLTTSASLTIFIMKSSTTTASISKYSLPVTSTTAANITINTIAKLFEINLSDEAFL